MYDSQTKLVTSEATTEAEDSNSIRKNYAVWQNFDWSYNGEHWTPNAEWKLRMIHGLIDPYVKQGGVTVEIGPGGGRWTKELARLSSQLILVDIAEACLEHCQKRFCTYDHIHYVHGNGNKLTGITNSSVDSIWSFDVFVHIAGEDIASYIQEFSRVLKHGGIGMIHHSGKGRTSNGWRSNMTADHFCCLLQESGLNCLKQFGGWHDTELLSVMNSRDTFSIFQKPLR